MADVRQFFDGFGRKRAAGNVAGAGAVAPGRLKAARLLFGLSVAASVLPLGAVNWVAFDFSNALVAISCLVGLAFSAQDGRLLALQLAAGSTALAFLLWVLPPGAPACRKPAGAARLARSRTERLGPIPGTASLDPGASFYALPALVSPFLTFIACLRLFGDDRSA